MKRTLTRRRLKGLVPTLLFFLLLASFGCGTGATEVSSVFAPGDECTWSDLPAGAPIVTRSGVYSSAYEATNLFDSADNTMWISAVNVTPAWLGYEYQAGQKRVLSYTLRFTNGSLTSRAPKDWTLQAWNGTAWQVIDTRSNQTGWKGVEERTFQVSAPGFYNKYRLNFTDDNDTRPAVVVISLGKVTFNVDTGCSYDWSKFEGSWHKDNNLSTATVDYYVPEATPVPVVRFVAAMKFKTGNAYERLMLAPNDAHYWAYGMWARSSDNKVSTSVQDPRLGTVNQTLRILSVSATSLRIAR